MPKSKPRDSKRQAVYDSEYAALHDHVSNTNFETIPRVREFVEKILRSQWYKAYKVMPTVVGGWERHPYRYCEIRDGRGRRRPCATTGVMKLPRAGRYKHVVLHELAHHMQTERRPWHGKQFRRIYLDLVRRWMGHDAWELLRAEYKKRNVRYVVARRP